MTEDAPRTPAATAAHMVKTYGREKARLNATDHAFSYDRDQPQHAWWLQVIEEIDSHKGNNP